MAQQSAERSLVASSGGVVVVVVEGCKCVHLSSRASTNLWCTCVDYLGSRITHIIRDAGLSGNGRSHPCDGRFQRRDIPDKRRPSHRSDRPSDVPEPGARVASCGRRLKAPELPAFRCYGDDERPAHYRGKVAGVTHGWAGLSGNRSPVAPAPSSRNAPPSRITQRPG